MAAATLPIKIQELFQLAALGINQSIVYTSLTMESEKYICVREQSPDGSICIVVVDMENPTQIKRRPISADSAIMNPKEPILALRIGQQLIFNTEHKKKLKAFHMPDPVVFWKWISDDTVAIVTATSVFHWSKNETEDPVKVFDRLPDLGSTIILNYHADSTQRWLCLIGISRGEGRIAGSIQLYSVEKNVSQLIEGYAASFASYSVVGSTRPSVLCVVAGRDNNVGKLLVLEVVKGDGPVFHTRTIDFPLSGPANDFPISVHISEKYEIVYVITKYGYVYIFDLSTGTLIFCERMSTKTLFVSVFQKSTEGVIGVNLKGQVLSVSIDETNIVSYIIHTLKNYDLAWSISRKNLGAAEMCNALFDQTFNKGDYLGAASLAAQSKSGSLRNLLTIQRFQALPTATNQPSPIMIYFNILLEKGKLNKVESLEFCKALRKQHRQNLVEKWIAEDKLEYSEELGDELKEHSHKLASLVYERAGNSDKLIALYAETKQYDKLVACTAPISTSDYQNLLMRIAAFNPAAAVAFASHLISKKGSPPLDLNSLAETLISRGLFQEASELFDLNKENERTPGEVGDLGPDETMRTADLQKKYEREVNAHAITEMARDKAERDCQAIKSKLDETVELFTAEKAKIHAEYSAELLRSAGLEGELNTVQQQYQLLCEKYDEECSHSVNLERALKDTELICTDTQLKLDEVVSQLNIEKAKNDFEQANKRRLVQIEQELGDIQQQYLHLSNKSNAETLEVEQQKAQLEMEQQRVNKIMEELAKKEQELKQKEEEQDARVKDWQGRIETITVAQQNEAPVAILAEVKEASDQVAANEREWKELQLKADEALHKFVQSKKSMQDKVETLENWLTLMEQNLPLPEAKCFNELLQAIQHMNTSPTKKKCFISYAWNVDKKENTKLQARLIQLKSDLVKAGIEVLLDIQNMEGDINHYMYGNIQQCDRVLLLKERIEEVGAINNLQREYQAALTRQAHNLKFIIPLVFEGTRETSICNSLPNILSLDFTDPIYYRERLTALNPKGLIPMILGLEDNPLYAVTLEWYKFKLDAQQRNVIA